MSFGQFGHLKDRCDFIVCKVNIMSHLKNETPMWALSRLSPDLCTFQISDSRLLPRDPPEDTACSHVNHIKSRQQKSGCHTTL